MHRVTRLRLRFLPNTDSLPGTLLWLTCAVYLAAIVLWWTFRVIFADAWWWLYLLNSAAVFLFVPLPFATVIAGLQRNLTLIVGCVFAVVLFLSVWGTLLWPHSRPEPQGPVLTVMTYNLLASNRNVEGVVGAIRESDADIVGLVELNQTIARAVRRDLADEYPHQVLMDQDEISGSGVISRYPLTQVDTFALEDPYWVGDPIAERAEGIAKQRCCALENFALVDCLLHRSLDTVEVKQV